MATSSARSGASTSQISRRPRSPYVVMAGEALATRRGRVGFTLVAVVVLIAALGPFLAPHPPNAFTTQQFASPRGGHLLGGDGLARDVLSRLLDGGWKLLLTAFLATVTGVGIGAFIGVVAAYAGGRIGAVLMRLMDVFLAFPQLLLVLLLVGIAGPSVTLLVVAVALAHLPQVARVMHAAALDICERDYIKFLELISLARRKVLASEVMPNLASPLMVEVGLRMTYSVIIISGLSFLGFGLPAPDPNWGSMINENRIGLSSNPWGVVAPVIMVAALTIGLNTFTDAISRGGSGGQSVARGRLWSRRSTRVSQKPSLTTPSSEVVGA